MTGLQNDPVSSTSLRVSLEAWEREAAAAWDGIIRSPHVLRRIGRQLDESFVTRQRIESALRRFASGANAGEASAREMAALRQLEAHLAALAARLEHLERQVDRD